MKKILIIAALISLTINLFAQDSTTSYSLDDCIKYALENSTSIKNADLDYQKSKYKVKETVASGLPQVNGKWDVLYNINLQKQFIPASVFDPTAPAGLIVPAAFGLKYSSNANFTVNQLIFDGSYLVGLKAAKEFTKLYDKTTSKTKTDIYVNVSKAYYLVLITKDRVGQLERSANLLEQLSTETRAFLNNGLAEETDLKRIKVNSNNINVELQKLEAFYKLTKDMLKFQMGLPLNNDITLSDSLELFLVDVVKTEEQPSFDTRPEFQMLQTQQRLNELNLSNERIRALPSLGAFFTAGINVGANRFGDAFKFSNYKEYSRAGVSLNVPIFSSFRRKQRINQSKVDINKTMNDLEMLKSSIVLESIKARNALNNSLDILEVRKENMDLAQEVYEHTKLKNQEGLVSSFELLSAQTDLKTAQTEYYNALYDVLVAKIDLEKANGKINN